MNTKISNNIIITDPTQFVLAWCKQNLVATNPVYRQLKVMGKEDTIKYKHIPETLNLFAVKRGELIVPYGCLYALWKEINKYPYEIDFNNSGDISFKNQEPILPLYDYQKQAVDEMIKAKGGVLVSSCGSGKSIAGIEIFKRIGKKTLWLCHTSDLLRQIKDDILQQYPTAKIGLTTNGKLDIGEDITISTVQTMVNIDPELYRNEFDIVVVDECAHVVGSPTQMKMFSTVLSNIKARYKFGLTATPTRADGLIRAMYAYIGLAQNGLFEPTFKVDDSKVKKIIAEHKRVELSTGYDSYRLFDLYDTSGMIVYNKLIDSLSENKERNEVILKNIYDNAVLGRKQVVLSLRVEHCEYLTEELKKQGIKAVLCVGKTKAKDREAILKQQIQWDVLVATYSLLKEGVSIKELDTLHMVTPIKEKGMVVQCAGRIERYLDGKKQPIIYDYVDTDIPYCEKSYLQRKRALKRRF